MSINSHQNEEQASFFSDWKAALDIQRVDQPYKMQLVIQYSMKQGIVQATKLLVVSL